MGVLVKPAVKYLLCWEGVPMGSTRTVAAIHT